MMFKSVVVAAVAASAVHAASTTEGSRDVYIRFDGCKNLKSTTGNPSRPYGYAGIDTSYLPFTTKYLRTSIGRQEKSGETVFTPDNILLWKNVYKASKQQIEVYLYGKHSLRPDSKVGAIDLDIQKVDGDCIPQQFLNQQVTSNYFFADAKCDFSVALCDSGVVPVGKDGKAWEVTGADSVYPRK